MKISIASYSFHGLRGADMMDVLRHFLDYTGADIVVLLQPTSPVREKGLVDRCIKRFQEKKADSLATGYNCKIFEYGSYSDNRQRLSGFFHDDGNVYLFKEGLIRQGRRIGERAERMEISKEQNFEIDDLFDFWLNEQILKNTEKSWI